jgi:diguanylate cyclase (GGDEF)-like protein
MSDYVAVGPIAIVAEDEATGRLLLGEAAMACGLEPKLFDNGVDALEATLSHDVAIVMLDVSMPGLDGYTVCRRIRENPRLASVPILMVTGLDDDVAITQAFEAGATDFIVKPVNWSLLPHRLSYMLRNAGVIRELADREYKVRALVDAIPDKLWVVSARGAPVWTPNGRRAAVNDRRIVGGVPESAPTFDAIVPKERLPEILTCISETSRDGGSRKLDYHDESQGISRSAELTFSRCDGGDVLVVKKDTSERTAAALQLTKLAYFDTLTGLPNRSHCIEIAARWITEVACPAAPRHGVAFMYLDLNGFKRINDAFGHSVGDLVLQRVADILSQTLAKFSAEVADLSLSRLGGDEFVILLRDAEPRRLALRIAEACCKALAEPITSGKLEFAATPSLGIALYPDDGSDVEALLKCADTAMYQAKAGVPPKVAVYTAAMSARLRDGLELEARLRRAIRDDALELKYQPKFRLSDRALVGFEALARWPDAEQGEVSPARFIPVAEESGLIVDLGAWLIRSVCRQLRIWMDRGLVFPVAINLSGKEFLFGDPARVIETEARACGVPPALIEVEITESVLVTDAVRCRSSVARIRELGCPIALDDFGTGFSSLSYLTRFPPDRLKIDRTFVRNIDRSPSDAAIVNAIMSLAQSARVLVTAEGIERQAQLDWLRQAGCHEGQGHFLSLPLNVESLERRFLTATVPVEPRVLVTSPVHRSAS